MAITQQVVFAFITALAFWFFVKRVKIIRKNILSGRDESFSDQKGRRWRTMARVALGQSKMTVRPLAGFFHILIYAGFVLINLEVLEIILDGFFGTHRLFQPFLGNFYPFLTGFFEILGLLVIIACVAFLLRRNAPGLARFKSPELKGFPIFDGNAILIIELVLMFALLVMNAADFQLQGNGGTPVSRYVTPLFSNLTPAAAHVVVKSAWWAHWVGILLFLNYIPYSKHLHIFLAFPNTYYSRLDPPGKIENMSSITPEVKMMLDPSFGAPENYVAAQSFGAKDATDLSWKNLMDAYTCTECGRCTSVCPANITGKLLSPRKIMMDTRDRIEEIGQKRDGKRNDESPEKTLSERITPEELWACTTCNACVEACPVNISPVDIIMQMRQYESMEKSAAPAELNAMMTNLENNGAPWQFAASDRQNWINEKY